MALADEWDLWIPDAYEIGSETVRSFGRATRCWHVPYAASKVVPADTVVPATMLGAPLMQVVAALVGKAIPGCNLSAILHVSESFTYLEPLRIGDLAGVGARLGSHIVKAETDLLTVECCVYVAGEPRVLAQILIAHSQRDLGIDLAAADALADLVMMTGTGPSASDAYSANIETSI